MPGLRVSENRFGPRQKVAGVSPQTHTYSARETAETSSHKIFPRSLPGCRALVAFSRFLPTLSGSAG